MSGSETPSSVGHEAGRIVGGLLENARKLVGQAVGMRAPDIIFTSGTRDKQPRVCRSEKGSWQVDQDARWGDGSQVGSLDVPRPRGGRLYAEYDACQK